MSPRHQRRHHQSADSAIYAAVSSSIELTATYCRSIDTVYGFRASSAPITPQRTPGEYVMCAGGRAELMVRCAARLLAMQIDILRRRQIMCISQLHADRVLPPIEVQGALAALGDYGNIALPATGESNHCRILQIVRRLLHINPLPESRVSLSEWLSICSCLLSGLHSWRSAADGCANSAVVTGLCDK